MPKNAKALAGEMEEMWTRAGREGRNPTAPEREKMQELVDVAKSQHEIEQQIKAMDPGAPLVARMNGDRAPAHGGGPGDRFIASKGYRQVADPSARAQSWSTGPDRGFVGTADSVDAAGPGDVQGHPARNGRRCRPGRRVGPALLRAGHRGQAARAARRGRRFRPVDGERLAGPLPRSS
jgi:hypothetical protein